MAKDKKVLLVDVSLQVRVVVDTQIDPDTDIDDFNKVVNKRIKARMDEEGAAFIGGGIEYYKDDLENPYDPELDD